VSTSPPDDQALDYDVVVVGAGFAGLYALCHLRACGFRVRVIEAGEGLGGTWFWNRYPGARVDVQSIEYSYSFSKEIEQEWNWTELMPTQPEVEAYINFVADRLDLRKDIQLSSRVTAMTYDEPSVTWTTRTDTGDHYRSRYVVAATGCLSAPLEPAIPGIQTFAGTTLYTNRFPRDGYDFLGKRVAVVGTGSSGVQCIPVIAEDALHLTVFQRSAAYTRPANCRPLEPGELEELKGNYDDIRRRQRASFAGLISFGAVSLEGIVPPAEKILETPVSERLAKLDAMGWDALSAWADVAVDIDANRAATDLYAELIRRAVKDPETARALTPDYPMGCKRQIIDTNYFATFNRPNVTLVDLRNGGITAVTPSGIETEQGHFDLDVIVWATGFDAMTGALNRIEIRGRDGRLLRDVWTSEGAVSYLGLQVAGFPNLFTITGPGSPSVLANMLFGIEQHVDWIAGCLLYMRQQDLLAVEATEQAQTDWVAHVASLVSGSIRSHPTCNSWYLGANIPGKKRVYMPYVGGQPTYRQKCEEIVEAGYEGFQFTAPAPKISL
jgi:cation diffusion facilitator CzcD-associated flavoprotein CzcO